MPPADIDAALPNGFHDSVLRELHLDYARSEARLAFDFLIGLPGAETEAGREATQKRVAPRRLENPRPRFAKCVP